MMHIAACLAMSVDGKLTAPLPADQPSHQAWVKLGTSADLERLFRLRDAHQALLFGASTFRAWPGIRWGWQHRMEPQPQDTPPVHVMLTHHWGIDWDDELFHFWPSQWPPFYVASSQAPPAVALECPCVRWIPLPADASEAEQLACVESVLQRQHAVETLLIEGGGEMMALALKARRIQTLYLTLTPWLIGGTSVPSLIGGEGVPLAEAPQVTWQEIRPEGKEIFLTGTVSYPT
jgi:riboflavin biosynthesis pyrimidine reductase